MLERHLAARRFVFAFLLAVSAQPALGQSAASQVQPLFGGVMVTVTPAKTLDSVPANGALDTVVFTVKNTGGVADKFNLTVTCTWVNCPNGTNPIPAGPVWLNVNASVTERVPFYNPGSALSATVSLMAADTADLVERTGTTTVVAVPPLVSLAPYSPDVFAAAGGAVYQHSTPAVGVMGGRRAVTLVYNSATVRPTVLLTLDVRNVTGGPYPSVYKLQVQRVGGAYLTLMNGSTAVYYAAATTTPTRMVAAIDAKANGLATGAYPVTVQVTGIYGQYASTDTVSSRILVNDESSSPYGAGVGLASVPSLLTVSGSAGMLLVDGSGSAAYFDRPDTQHKHFTSPAGVSSTLVDTSWGYRLTALDGSSYDFDASGNLEYHNSLPNAHDLTFTCWAGSCSAITLAYDHFITLSYSGGHLTGITDSAARTTSLSIVNGQLRSVTDPDGRADTLGYRSDSLLNRIVDRGGGVTNIGYNALNQVQADTGPSATDYTGYSVRPSEATMTAAVVVWQPNTPGTSQGSPKANARPDTVMASVTDPLGAVTRVAQDRFGLPTKVVDALHDTTTITRDSLGNTLLVVAPNGHKTVGMYDGYLLVAQNDTSAGQYLTFTYDSSTSRHLETIRGGPVRLDYFYNTASDPGALGALKLEYAGDTQGSGVWPPSGGDSLAHHFVDGYGRDTLVVDGLGHGTRWSYASEAMGGNLAQGINAAGYAATYSYNGYGLLATATVPTLGTDSIFYDTLGRTTRTGTALGGSTQRAYGALGALTRVTDPSGQVYKFDMNAWGLATAVHDLGDTTKADSAWYDVGGNARTVKTRRGDVIAMTYDSLERLVKRSGPDFAAESLYYCPRGTCVVAINANGRDSIAYDLVGRVTSVVQGMPDGQTRDTIQYQYDSLSRVVRRQSPSGSAPLATARWVYNAKYGLVDTLCQAGACAGIHRDYEMKPDTITYQAGSGSSWWQAFLYNNRHLPTLQFFSVAADSMFRLRISYDSLGHADTLQPYSDVNPHTRYLSYDLLGRLTNDCSYNGQPYCFNEYGNFQTAYAYDSAGNDTKWGAAIAGNRYSGFAGQTLTYDANGAVTVKRNIWAADTTTFTWNALGQLTVVRRDSAGQLTLDSLRYDALGHRVAKSVNGTTTWFTYDGDQVILDRSGGAPHGVLAEYGFDGASLFAVRTPSDTLVAMLAPTNGTLLGLAKANGGAVSRTYDVLGTPFGQQARDLSGLVLRYKMGSQEYDQETGLYHLGARYYDPQLHRFLSEDPIGIAGGLNLYAYAGNNPINGLDPSGECWIFFPGEYGGWVDWPDSADVCKHTDTGGEASSGDSWSTSPGASGSESTKKPPAAPTSCTTAPTTWFPHSVGVAAQAGYARPFLSAPGSGVVGSVEGGAALFVGNGGVRSGSWAGGGGMIGGPVGSVGAPGGASPPAWQAVVGGTPSASAGAGGFISNARGASELSGDFTNYSITFLNFSVTVAVGGPVWTLTATYSPAGNGVSYASYQTHTAITNGGNGCGR